MVGLLAAAPAHAATIDFSTAPCTAGLNTCGPLASLLTLSSVGGKFAYKTFNGETGLGITDSTGDPTPGGIDVDESISGSFSQGVRLDSFQLLFIYNGPEFQDPTEVARVGINGNVFATFTVSGENSGTWTGFGGASIVNCGATTDQGTGCFNVLNPFGNALVNSITFQALSVTARPPAANDSDYSLGALAFTVPVGTPQDTLPAPEPGSLLLLGTGLLGLGRAARRRFRGAR